MKLAILCAFLMAHASAINIRVESEPQERPTPRAGQASTEARPHEGSPVDDSFQGRI